MLRNFFNSIRMVLLKQKKGTTPMNRLMEQIKNELNIDLVRVIISNPRHKTECNKIKIRPVLIKEALYFQCSKQEGKKILHENLTYEEVVSQIESWMLCEFKQIEVTSRTKVITAMVNKKGTATFKVKNQVTQGTKDLSHNRKKQYILEEGEVVPFLVDLNVMSKDGKILKPKYDKFKQINRFLEFIRDVVEYLPKDRKSTIIDFGCGKSYLTFAMYYYLKEKLGLDIQIIGLDLKKDVIEHCNSLAEKYGYDELCFYEGSIEEFTKVNQVDMVVTLHACDTATDYALHKAITWGAKVILSVPCCQHELNGQIENEILQPILKYGLIKERMAALITDGVRGQLLEAAGYHTQIMEFIDLEHTPKNILIRGIKTKEGKGNLEEYNKLKEFLHIQPTLEQLLQDSVMK